MTDPTIVDLVAAQVRDRLGREQDRLNAERAAVDADLGALLMRDLLPAEWEGLSFLRPDEVGIGYSQVHGSEGGFRFYHSSVVIADRLATALTTEEGLELDRRAAEHGNADSGTNLIDAYLTAVWHTVEVTITRWDTHPAGTSKGVRYAEAFAHLASHSLDLAKILTWVDGTFTHPPTVIGS